MALFWLSYFSSCCSALTRAIRSGGMVAAGMKLFPPTQGTLLASVLVRCTETRDLLLLPPGGSKVPAMVWATETALWESGCASTVTVDSPRADERPALTWTVADFSTPSSRPATIAWTRKKPSTAMTRTDRTKVVETTRSWSERCQRILASATARRCHRRPARSPRLTRSGSRRLIDRPKEDRRNAVIQSRCHRLRTAVTS